MGNPDPIHAHPQSRDRDESVHGNSAPVQLLRLSISDRTLSVVAIIFSCLALGAIVMHAILYPQIVDAKISAGVSKAEATAQTAKEHARVALDKIEQTQVQLGAKGLVQPSTH